MNNINKQAAVALATGQTYNRFGRTVTISGNTATLAMLGRPIVVTDMATGTIAVCEGIQGKRQWMRIANTALAVYRAGRVEGRKGKLYIKNDIDK